ncbi:MAG: hypothetical protein LBI94_03815, partial [Treponema sp.]|nr:hypothetical protein [Treponema sp.]
WAHPRPPGYLKKYFVPPYDQYDNSAAGDRAIRFNSSTLPQVKSFTCGKVCGISASIPCAFGAAAFFPAQGNVVGQG